MKKRHEQKLVVLSIALGVLLNVPLVLVFDQSGQWMGIPFFFLSMILIWAISIGVSWFILSRFYE